MNPLDRPPPAAAPPRTKLSDIARAAGVSIATASRALSRPELVSRATREAVQAAAARAEYRPNLAARSLRTQSTAAVFVLLQDVADPGCAELLRGFDWTAHERGYSLILGVTGQQAERKAAYLDMALQQRADGLLLLDGLLDDGLAARLAGRLPAVQVLERRPGLALPSVTVDDREAARAAVAYLLSLGHRRIGHISGAPQSLATPLRMDGYRAALIGAGLPFEPDLMISGGTCYVSGLAAAGALMSRAPRPTALFCGSDLLASSAIHWATLNGLRVPDQVSVVGCDGLDCAPITQPPLTTMRLPRYDVAAEAMRLLLALISGRAVAEPHPVLQAELVVRGSAAAA